MLSEEEKKAIEFLKFYQQQCLKEEMNNIDNYKTTNDEEFVSKNLKIVLKLITKLQKENEEKDRQIKTLKHTNKTYKGMLNKQSKQIDLMAGEIEYAGCIKKVWGCDEKDCIDCIKQYFETKAKKEQ